MPGVDHDDSDEDSFANVGTAFELLETPEDIQKAKKQKEKEQYVTDEQGRRRFHGAFTGGFSAGYYNTVGSKEGWTPASFTSSRAKKAEIAAQRPEDFMDSEDLGEHGIAPREVAAKEQFAEQRAAGAKRPQPTMQPSVIPGEPPLQNLIVPVKSTIGAKLLSAMGWRAGQGVGPKEKRSSMKAGPKVYGCSLPGQEEGGSGLEVEAADETAADDFLFAPKDVKPWEFEAKDDVHGIGYSGMQEQSVLSTQQTSKALYGMSGQAFGTGALEEEEDEDIFAEESVAAYHASIAQEGDVAMEMKFGWTGVDADSDSWNLACFVKAKDPFIPAKHYPPPHIPRDFCLVHKFSSSTDKESNTGAGKGTRPLTSHERANIIAANNDELPSVFALVSVQDRDRLKRVSEMAQQVNRGQLMLQEAHKRSQLVADERLQKKQPEHTAALKPLPAGPAGVLSGSLSSTTAAGSLPSPAAGYSRRGHTTDTSVGISPEALKPFSSDPQKQMRYEAFLIGRIENGQSMTEWEQQREREEFARTARVHQPLTTSLTSKFTHAKEDQKEESEGEESDAVQAAKVNMFGVLTRETLEWHPHKTLCKRFNVPEPYPRSEAVGVVTDEERRKMRNRERAFVRESAEAKGQEPDHHGYRMRTESGPQTINFQPAVEPTEEGVGQRDDIQDGIARQAKSGDKESSHGDEESSHGDREGSQPPESKEEEVVVIPRPPMDLFKAIFAGDSSEDEEVAGDGGEEVAGDGGEEVAGGSASSIVAPSTLNTKAPSTSSTIAPSTLSTIAPSTSSTKAPSTPSTKAPSTLSTKAPSTPSTKAPSTPSTKAPSTPSTKAPSTPSTKAPPTPMMPIVSTQVVNTDQAALHVQGHSATTARPWQNLSLIANRVPEITLDTVAMVTAGSTGPQASDALKVVTPSPRPVEDNASQTIASYGPALPPPGHMTSNIPSMLEEQPSNKHSNAKKSQHKHKHKHKTEHRERDKKEKPHRKQIHS